MDERYKYKWGEHGLFPDIKHLAEVAVRQLTTQTLATHGDHFVRDLDHRVHLPLEPSFEDCYGTVIDIPTGPEFYDRQGYPIYPQDIEIMRHMKRDGTS